MTWNLTSHPKGPKQGMGIEGAMAEKPWIGDRLGYGSRRKSDIERNIVTCDDSTLGTDFRAECLQAIAGFSWT